jgi:speckle-type POZ protein
VTEIFEFSLLDEMGEPVPLYTKGTCGCDVNTIKRPGCSSWGYERLIKVAMEESTYLKDDCFRVRCDVIVSKEKVYRTEETTQLVTVLASDMNQHIGCLLSSGADVTIQVGRRDHGHTWARARSSVFVADVVG